MSITSKPAPSIIIATRFLPMSWMSPLTVPMTILPTGSAPVSASNGRRISMPALHGVGRQQHLGHEEDSVAEVDADDPHALDQRIGEDAVGRPTAVEEDRRALDDLVGQAVVEVVVHLLDELVVVEGREIDVVALIGHRLLHYAFGEAVHHAEHVRIVELYRIGSAGGERHLGKHQQPAELLRAAGRDEVALARRHDRPLHQDVPLAGEVVRVGDAGLRRELDQELADARQLLTAGNVDRVLAVIDLEQGVDEEAALEVASVEPVVEDVEDGEQAIDRALGTAAHLPLEPFPVHSCSRRSSTASTRSSLDPKWRYTVIFATPERSMIVSTPTALMPCRQKSV